MRNQLDASKIFSTVAAIARIAAVAPWVIVGAVAVSAAVVLGLIVFY